VTGEVLPASVHGALGKLFSVTIANLSQLRRHQRCPTRNCSACRKPRVTQHERRGSGSCMLPDARRRSCGARRSSEWHKNILWGDLTRIVLGTDRSGLSPSRRIPGSESYFRRHTDCPYDHCISVMKSSTKLASYQKCTNTSQSLVPRQIGFADMVIKAIHVPCRLASSSSRPLEAYR
jgi:hypothetical protein